MELKRIGVLSFAKVAAVLYALFGLLFGAVFSMISVMGNVLASQRSGPLWFPAFGAAAVIILPVVYGVMGFVFSLIMAGLYNLVAGMVGGVHVELRSVAPPESATNR